MQVIADIAKRMGHGMAEFIESEVLSVADYDRYCHYVAGLVGIGLSQASSLHENIELSFPSILLYKLAGFTNMSTGVLCLPCSRCERLKWH